MAFLSQKRLRVLRRVPKRVVIDSARIVKPRTCHHDPEVQRTYSANTGSVFDKSTGLELDTIDTTELYLAAAIATSKLDFSEWGDAIPNQLLGAATLDRIRHGPCRVILDGNGYRCPKPLPQAPEKYLGNEVEKH